MELIKCEDKGIMFDIRVEYYMAHDGVGNDKHDEEVMVMKKLRDMVAKGLYNLIGVMVFLLMAAMVVGFFTIVGGYIAFILIGVVCLIVIGALAKLIEILTGKKA